MPRSRRFLAFCALIAILAWTNVQAMTCCWSLDLASAMSNAMPAVTGLPAGAPEVDHQTFTEAAGPMPPSCHGPAVASSSSRTSPETENTATHEPGHASAQENPLAETFPALAAGAAGFSDSCASPDASCRDLASPSSPLAACCDAPAPAESFSALLRLEPLPPQAFHAATPAPSGVAPSLDSHSLPPPGAPRFLALERLLI